MGDDDNEDGDYRHCNACGSDYYDDDEEECIYCGSSDTEVVFDD